ncbi:MAG: peptidase M23 [Puniceicoccaceae bacterium 5H]|nr:MAG: peptidase M23 [Puniceicoccaceae bacterium 5H]
MIRLLCLCPCLFLFVLRAAAVPLLWPIDGPSILEGDQLEDWAQPTVSGDPESALFGCVRTNGHRFHEALDIAATHWDNRREATDVVHAIMPGRVVYMNPIAGDSSFGRYVVLEHTGLKPSVYSLYAHLRSIDDDLKVGQDVKEGTKLGILGRSASYSIPRQRAHVHLEIGLRLSDDFQSWYDRQPFGSKNQHGIWNGMNLVGFDPREFYTFFSNGEADDLQLFWASMPPAAVLQIRTRVIPDLVKRYPTLLDGPLPQSVEGWEVSLTGYGLPLTLRPLSQDEAQGLGDYGAVKIVAVDPEQLEKFACRDVVKWDGETARLDSEGKDLLSRIFDIRE